MMPVTTSTLFSILAAFQAVHAHSWAEQLRLIGADGRFIEAPGYSTPFFARAPGFSVDPLMQNQILDKGSNPDVCKPAGGFQYSAAVPRLTASAGDYVAIQYHENGHVTDPEQTPRKFRGGNVYVYGTLGDAKAERLNDVLYSWDEAGTGGNGNGQLIGAHFFDDGQCFQNRIANPTAIFNERSSRLGVNELLCQTDFRLPENLPSDGIYTVMWVWDWPRIQADGSETVEIYTSCAEIQLRPGRNTGTPLVSYQGLGLEGPGEYAIQSQIDNLIEFDSLGVGSQPPTVARKRETQGNKIFMGSTGSASYNKAPRSIPEVTTFRRLVRAVAAQPIGV
ncbi:hypothetical protein S40285_09350 [Stachybotrys chlorohalonatus IBT 40285]|uniref:DUF7492 domain-containing protein n=1 Tax=Stachybotrys chlorohalonatus (strain IBT 40285) TaxID=1283841 RepID=A0A084QYH1_STAC4|nr:hypothetical protein S40285_09350 [Stachybotrys chlorohalonata IBT 40285]